jgi:uncharacterized protein YndB with AHSA1/START domain
MSVVDVRKDFEAKVLTITVEFEAPIDRVWELWSDPRQLEGWWGPPSHPATVVDHDLVPGGRVTYYLTSPEGEQLYGWWRVESVDAPRRLVFEDGFGDETGRPRSDMPTTTNVVTLSQLPTRDTRMVIETRFSSSEAMEHVLESGFAESISSSLAKVGQLLEEDATTS